MDWQNTYAAMPDDQLLLLATKPGELRDEARSALEVELQRRNLGARDIKPYEHVLDDLTPNKILSGMKPVEVRGKPAYIARSVLGIGTMLYGKRDFGAFQSYVTTKWIVLFYFPLLPLQSLRVKELPSYGIVESKANRVEIEQDHGKYGRNRNFYVVEAEVSRDWTQVAYVDMYSLGCLAIPYILVRTARVSDYVLVALAAYAILPWCLRQISMKKARESRGSS